MNSKKERNLIIRVTEYAIEHDSFELSQLIKDLELGQDDARFLMGSLVSKSTIADNPNHILVVGNPDILRTVKENESGGKHYSELRKPYRLLPTAFYNYVDYLEIKEARKQAVEAKQQASLAIQLTVYAIVISVLLGAGQIFFK
jgi:hypothetical protein